MFEFVKWEDGIGVKVVSPMFILKLFNANALDDRFVRSRPSPLAVRDEIQASRAVGRGDKGVSAISQRLADGENDDRVPESSGTEICQSIQTRDGTAVTTSFARGHGSSRGS